MSDSSSECEEDERIDGIVMVRGGTQGFVKIRQNPIFYLAVHHIKSSDNLGKLLRTAGAFGCEEVLVVNNERTSKRIRKSTKTYGAHGADRHVPIRAFGTLEDLLAFARRQGCDIVGIEIDDKAIPYTQNANAYGNPPKPICFLPGNEGQGLSKKQIDMTDRLVYVPHFGEATASLNVNAATAIILSQFAIFAGYQETSKTGAKFHVPIHDRREGQLSSAPETQHRADAVDHADKI